MKISPVRNNVFYKPINNNRKNFLPSQKIASKPDFKNTKYKLPYSVYYLNSISFKSREYYEQDFFSNPDFEDFISGKGKVSIAEYQTIKQQKPEIIDMAKEFAKNETGRLKLNQTPKDTAKLVQKIKEDFDDKFGEDGYIIVSVGTSPAFLTESLSAMGKEVLFVPVSGLNSVHKKDNLEDFFEDYPRVNTVARYIKNYFSKQELKPDTKVIVMDFVSSGSTIDFITDIIEQKCEISPSQIFKCNLGHEMYDVYNEEYFALDCDGYFKDVLKQRVYEIANVPHYHIWLQKPHFALYPTDDYKYDQDDGYKELENYSSPLGRAYQLLVLDELEKMKSS